MRSNDSLKKQKRPPLSQVLIVISVGFCAWCTEEEEDSDKGASRGLPLSRDCNSELGARGEEGEGAAVER